MSADPEVDESRAWFEGAFERGYLDVYPHRDVASARAEVARLVERGLGSAPAHDGDGPRTVLDLGCGFGRHTLAMLELGLDVCGLDLSLDLLRHAAQLESAAHLHGRLVRGDFRRLPFAASSFGTVVMLFSSFGYFDDETNGHVLNEIARVLAPGGTAILDLMNAERVRANLVPESRTEKDGYVMHERRQLTSDGRRVRKDVTRIDRDGNERSWHEDVRLYDPPELESLLDAHGMVVLRMEGDFDGRADDADAPRRIVWARRADRPILDA